MQKEWVEHAWEYAFKPNKEFKNYGDFPSKKEAFLNYCIVLPKPKGDAKPLDRTDLENQMDQLDQLKDAKTMDELTLPSEVILDKETMTLLENPLVSSSSNQMQSFFQKIGNSDWVHSGIALLEKTDNHCPFCGQTLSSEKEEEIKSVFDDVYEQSLNRIRELKNRFEDALVELDGKNYSENQYFGEVKTFATAFDQYQSSLKEICNVIDKKIEHPSESISIPDYQTKFNIFVDEINAINSKIRKNNEIVNNWKKEKEQFAQRVKDRIAADFWDDVSKGSQGKIKGHQKTIEKNKAQILGLEADIEKKEKEYRNVVNGMTTITKTVNDINDILKQFGFQGFYLIETEDHKHYQILRNGSNEPVKNTLSEGEKNFVSFLYFYYSLKGTFNKGEVNNQPIVFIDDPVSSLDSNILFIVGSLLGDLIKECKDKKGLNQLIVSTHNAYFYRVLENKLQNLSLKNKNKQLSYLVLEKKNEQTQVVSYDTCPIISSYETLWEAVANATTNDYVVVLNCMRRIIFEYFNFTGGSEYSDVVDKMENVGQKKVAQTLITAINTGSHVIGDDFNYSLNNEDKETLLAAFHNFFVMTGQSSHYDKMMELVKKEKAPTA